MKIYTKNWNEAFVQNIIKVDDFSLCLEIGCFEGLTTNYIIDNYISNNGKIICVDPLTDVYLNDNLCENDIELNNTEYIFFNGQYERFINNTKEHINSGKLILYKDLSINVFEELNSNYGDNFSFIYIDGDHRPNSVYLDVVNSFNLCKKNGYILFDDYLCKDTSICIDKFLNENENKFLLLEKNEQVLIKKI